jgi:hypothetical protein
VLERFGVVENGEMGFGSNFGTTLATAKRATYRSSEEQIGRRTDESRQDITPYQLLEYK